MPTNKTATLYQQLLATQVLANRNVGHCYGCKQPEQRHEVPVGLRSRCQAWFLLNNEYWMRIWLYFWSSLYIVEIWWGISVGAFERICIKTTCPVSTWAISWFPSPTSIIFNKTHTMWWHVLLFANCNELQSKENWLPTKTVYLVPPCFISTSA